MAKKAKKKAKKKSPNHSDKALKIHTDNWANVLKVAVTVPEKEK